MVPDNFKQAEKKKEVGKGNGTWTLADGKIVPISSLRVDQVRDAINLVWPRVRDNSISMMWFHMRNLLQELKDRKVDTNNSLLEQAKQNCLVLEKAHNGKLPPLTNPIEEQNRKMREVKEKEWQEKEARMLPEGAKDQLVKELYCQVDPVTRRLVNQGMNNGLPDFYDYRRTNLSKRVRVTIEVLEE